MKFLIGILIALASCLNGCTPSNVVPPPPDADGSIVVIVTVTDSGISEAAPAPADCPRMCAKLHDLGCPEGEFSDCASVCTKNLNDPGFRPPPVSCVLSASSQDAVRACGLRCVVIPAVKK
jgi:hypothetical protein